MKEALKIFFRFKFYKWIELLKHNLKEMNQQWQTEYMGLIILFSLSLLSSLFKYK